MKLKAGCGSETGICPRVAFEIIGLCYARERKVRRLG